MCQSCVKGAKISTVPNDSGEPRPEEEPEEPEQQQYAFEKVGRDLELI
jgi:hypothetical protein